MPSTASRCATAAALVVIPATCMGILKCTMGRRGNTKGSQRQRRTTAVPPNATPPAGAGVPPIKAKRPPRCLSILAVALVAFIALVATVADCEQTLSQPSGHYDDSLRESPLDRAACAEDDSEKSQKAAQDVEKEEIDVEGPKENFEKPKSMRSRRSSQKPMSQKERRENAAVGAEGKPEPRGEIVIKSNDGARDYHVFIERSTQRSSEESRQAIHSRLTADEERRKPKRELAKRTLATNIELYDRPPGSKKSSKESLKSSKEGRDERRPASKKSSKESMKSDKQRGDGPDRPPSLKKSSKESLKSDKQRRQESRKSIKEGPSKRREKSRRDTEKSVSARKSRSISQRAKKFVSRLSPSRRSKKRRKIKENETSSQKGFKEKAKRKTGSVDASQSDKNKKDKTTGSSRSVSKKSRRKKKKGGSLEGSKKSEKDRSTKGSRRSKKASSKWGKREGDSDKSSSRGSVRTAKESSPSSRKARHKIVSVRSAMAHPLSSNKETRSSPEPAEPWYVMAEDVTQQSTSAEQEVERIEKVKSEQFAKSHGSSGSLQADPCVAVGQDAPPSKQISRKEKTSSKKMRRMKKKKKKTSAEGDPRPNNDVESLVQLGIFRRRQAFKSVKESSKRKKKTKGGDGSSKKARMSSGRWKKNRLQKFLQSDEDVVILPPELPDEELEKRAQTANSFGTAQAGNDEVKNAAAKDDEVLLKGIGQLDEAARVSAGRSNNARRQSRPKHRPGKESRGSKKGAWDSNPPPSDPSPFPPPREQSAELQRLGGDNESKKQRKKPSQKDVEQESGSVVMIRPQDLVVHGSLRAKKDKKVIPSEYYANLDVPSNRERGRDDSSKKARRHERHDREYDKSDRRPEENQPPQKKRQLTSQELLDEMLKKLDDPSLKRARQKEPKREHKRPQPDEPVIVDLSEWLLGGRDEKEMEPRMQGSTHSSGRSRGKSRKSGSAKSSSSGSRRRTWRCSKDARERDRWRHRR